MALSIKQLGAGKVRSDNYAGSDTQNRLYLAAAGKSAVIASFAFVNIGGGATDLHVFLRRATEAIGNRRKLGFYKSLPVSTSTGTRYLISSEITLGPGDSIYADTGSNDNYVDFVLSGVERDVPQ
jgi:hypothetical protein